MITDDHEFVFCIKIIIEKNADNEMAVFRFLFTFKKIFQ